MEGLQIQRHSNRLVNIFIYMEYFIINNISSFTGANINRGMYFDNLAMQIMEILPCIFYCYCFAGSEFGWV